MISVFKKIRWYHWIFFGLLLFQFLVRTIVADVPSVTAGDSNRDYIIAHLIATEHQFPLTGPSNGVFEALGNSPLYYYLISIPIFLVDDPLTLSIFQALVATATLICIFIFAEILFGGLVALLAASLIAVSFSFIFEQHYIWQPFLMMPFLYASFIALAYAHKRRSSKAAILGNILFAVALVLHNAVLAFVPLFWILTWNIVAKGPFNLKRLGAILCGVCTIVLLYLPTLIYHAVSGEKQNFFFKYPHIPDIVSIIENGAQGAVTSFNTLFDFFGFSINSGALEGKFFLALMGICIIIFIFVKKDPKQKYYLIVLVLALFSLIGSIAFLNIFFPIKQALFYQYTLTGYPLIAITFSYIFVTIFSSHKFLKILCIVPLAYILISSMNPHHFAQMLQADPNSNRDQLQDMTEAITKSVQEIEQKQDYTDLHFFQVKAFMDNTPYNTFIITSLEKALGESFIKIDNSEWYTIAQTNTDDYIYVLCDSIYFGKNADSHKKCRQEFQDVVGDTYVFERSIFSQDTMNIMVFKKNI